MSKESIVYASDAGLAPGLPNNKEPGRRPPILLLPAMSDDNLELLSCGTSVVVVEEAKVVSELFSSSSSSLFSSGCFSSAFSVDVSTGGKPGRRRGSKPDTRALRFVGGPCGAILGAFSVTRNLGRFLRRVKGSEGAGVVVSAG